MTLCENYQDPTSKYGDVAGHGVWISVHCDLDLGDMILSHKQQLYRP